MQNVSFAEPGTVSFTEATWLTEYPDDSPTPGTPPPPTNAPFLGWPWFAQPPVATFSNTTATGLDASVWTLNLPLLGVLKTIDSVGEPVATVARLVVQQYYRQPSLAADFAGLFMRRCGSLRATLIHYFAELWIPLVSACAFDGEQACLGERVRNVLRRTVRELLFGYHDELLSTVALYLPVYAGSTFVSLVATGSDPADAQSSSSSADAAVGGGGGAPAPTVMATGAGGNTPRWEFVQWRGQTRVPCAAGAVQQGARHSCRLAACPSLRS